MAASWTWLHVSTLALAIGLAGCEPPLPPAITLDVKGLQPTAGYSSLDQVLQKTIDTEGLAWINALKNQEAALDSQIKLLSITGPTATPQLFATEEQRLAYWYNARCAWSLKLMLAAGCPEQFDRPVAFRGRPFPLDGRTMSLDAIDAVLSADGDWRTLAAAPGVSEQEAALPAKAFAAEGIREEIARRFQQFVASPRFVVDVERKRVLAPPTLWALRGRLTRQYEQAYHTRDAKFQTALLPFLEGLSARKIRDAAGYSCLPLPQSPLRMAVAPRSRWAVQASGPSDATCPD